jgi:predicted phage-related endonuclease
MSLQFKPVNRREFVGGSDARVIMGDDENALLRLWREKRGEVEPEDLSGNLIVQLGLATEALNRDWYERNTGQTIECVQHRIRHPVLRWMGAKLDGMVVGSGAVFEAKFMLPWTFSEEAATEKHMAQLQHNMWVTNAKAAALSIITGGGKWVEIAITASDRREEVLALRREWRAPSAIWRRATAAPHRGPPRRRYELVQCLGRVCRRVLPDPIGISGARKRQGRAEGPDAGGRQGGHWAWDPGQTVEIRSRELRCPRSGGS